MLILDTSTTPDRDVSHNQLEFSPITQDPYVLDFDDIKTPTKLLCKELTEKTLLPMFSNVLQFGEYDLRCEQKGDTKVGSSAKAREVVGKKNDENDHTGVPAEAFPFFPSNIVMSTGDGSVFSLPKKDCMLLPIVATTCEELALWMWKTLFKNFGGQKFFKEERDISWMQVAVFESPTQGAHVSFEIDDVVVQDEKFLAGAGFCDERMLNSSGGKDHVPTTGLAALASNMASNMVDTTTVVDVEETLTTQEQVSAMMEDDVENGGIMVSKFAR